MKPPLACKNCRARKKKCDRAYPACSYCLRTHDRCEYRVDGHANSTVRPIATVAPRTNQSEGAKMVQFNTQMFLGGSNPNKTIAMPPSLRSIAVGPDVLEYIQGSGQTHRQQWISNFIDTVDHWIPFIPLNDIPAATSSDLNNLNAEEAILLACIRLNADSLPDNQPLNKQYLAIKSAFMTIEIYGTYSIKLLQASLQLLIYEFSHGIFPSAYTTLGCCARYLGALDVEAALERRDTGDWIRQEQLRRLWWSVYVMERIIALGCPQYPLSLREPDDNHILPSDDVSWKQEYPSADATLTLLSPASSNMGTFRLLVHAAYLVGRVIQVVSDYSSGDQSTSTRRTQLYRTICALATLLEVELQTSIVLVSVARSLINSALFLLYSFHDPGANDSEIGAIYDLDHPLSKSAHTCLGLTKIYISGEYASSRRASPFLLCWGFQTYKFFYDRYNLDGHHQSLQALDTMRKGMESLGNRWKLERIYALLLNSN